MCTGIALAYSELPLYVIERHGLNKRVHERGGEPEVRFLYRAADRVLPVWHEGQLQVVRWGSRRNQTKVLPCTGWTWLAAVEEGRWATWEGVEVVVPATMGLENGVWFRIRQGIRGVLVCDEKGEAVVYLMVEPASHYYKTMTKSVRMPVLIGERI
jgi:hypothetical protein